MAFFWQRKKEEKEKTQAQKKTSATKKELVKKGASVKNAKKVSKASAPKPTSTGKAYKVLLGPVITEKTTRLAELGTYAFEVTPQANKIEIAQAVAAVYGVEPIKVNKTKLRGKSKMFSQKSGKRKTRHKALVTLKKGQSIELFEKV